MKLVKQPNEQKKAPSKIERDIYYKADMTMSRKQNMDESENAANNNSSHQHQQIHDLQQNDISMGMILLVN